MPLTPSLYPILPNIETKTSSLSSNTDKHLVIELVNNLKRNTDAYAVSHIFETLIDRIFYGVTTCETRLLRQVIIGVIIHTRDIVNGKGEYALYYLLVGVLLQTIEKHQSQVSREKTEIMMTLLKRVITSSVFLEGQYQPYGSWKDMKYLLNHLRKLYGEDILIESHIFSYIMRVICEQLKKDSVSSEPTLLAKWCPREKSNKFGWQAKYIAFEYDDMNTCDNEAVNIPVSEKHLRKCFRNYRKTIAQINKRLNTPQVKQCAGEWASINFDRDVSTTTLRCQKNAFLFTDKHGKSRSRLCVYNDNDYDLSLIHI